MSVQVFSSESPPLVLQALQEGTLASVATE
jgi:hypothetical protein